MKIFPVLLLFFSVSIGLAQDQSKIITLSNNDSVQILFVYIPAASYKIGSPLTEIGRDGDEAPQQEKKSKTILFW